MTPLISEIRCSLKDEREHSGDVGRGDDSEIRRANFIEGKSIKQICREPRVFRNTVRKVIRSGATEFTYDGSTQPRPKLDPWRSELDAMLAENARRPKRERMTTIRIYEELRNRGYGGGYDAHCVATRPVGPKRHSKPRRAPMFR